MESEDRGSLSVGRGYMKVARLLDSLLEAGEEGRGLKEGVGTSKKC